jgi:hypothetical protein
MIYKLDAEGYLIGDDGKRALVNGADIKVEGSMGQEAVNKLVGAKRAEIRAEFAAKISDLEAKAAAADPEAVAELKAKITELEGKTVNADTIAARKIAEKERAFNTEKAALEAKAAQGEKLYRAERMRNALVSSAAEFGFLDPADVVAHLGGAAKWEPVVGDDGNPTGDVSLGFEVEVKGEGGKVERKVMDARAAVEAQAKAKPYLVKTEVKPGSGAHGGAKFPTSAAPSGKTWEAAYKTS